MEPFTPYFTVARRSTPGWWDYLNKQVERETGFALILAAYFKHADRTRQIVVRDGEVTLFLLDAHPDRGFNANVIGKYQLSLRIGSTDDLYAAKFFFDAGIEFITLPGLLWHDTPAEKLGA